MDMSHKYGNYALPGVGMQSTAWSGSTLEKKKKKKIMVKCSVELDV